MARVKGLWLDIADWRRLTAGLTPEEKGGYIELLMTCVENDGRLDNDSQRLRICTGFLVRIWNSFLRRLMPQLFYQTPDGCWRSKIIDFQLERAEKIKEVRRAAGQNGAQARWQTDSNDDGKPLANAKAIAMANATIRAPNLESVERKGLEADASPVFSSLRSEKTSPHAANLVLWTKVKKLKVEKGAVGRLLREVGTVKVEAALAAVERTKPANPTPFFVACCQDRVPTANGNDEPEPFTGPKEPLTDEMRDRILAKLRGEEETPHAPTGDQTARQEPH